MRGSVLDIIIFGALAIGLLFLAFIMYYVTDQFNNAAYAAFDKTNINKTYLTPFNKTTEAAGNFVNTVPLVVGGVGLVIAISAAYTGASVYLLGFGILMFLIAVLFFSQLQTVMPTILGTSFFATLSVQFPYAASIGLNIGYLVLGIGALVLIVLYARFKSQNAGGLPEG